MAPDLPLSEPGSDVLENNPARLSWPEVQVIAPRRYRLQADFSIEWKSGFFPRQRLVVPAGFECDGASVPRVLEWYLGRENILPASLVHDWQYTYAGRLPWKTHFFLHPEEGHWEPIRYVWSRVEVDRFFARNLRHCPVCEIRRGQRRLAYRAVRLFGGIHWRRAEEKRELAAEAIVNRAKNVPGKVSS